MSDYTNRGAIWKNDRKERDSQPDLRGSLNVEGTDYWVSAWVRTDEEKERNPRAPALKFSIQKKDEVGAAPEPEQQGFREPATVAELTTPAPVSDGFEDPVIPF
jgi:hypothetical protein